MEAEVKAHPQAGKRRVEVYRAADAIDMAVSGMRDGLPIRSDDTALALARNREAGIDAGFTSNLLFRQENAFSILILWVKPNYPLARHSHDSDCLYYVASGSIQMGTETLKVGDGFFVPADALYVYSGGPEGAEVLEIRYGVNKIKTTIPDVPAKAWDTALDAVRTNVAQWREMTVSPTFAANMAP